MPVMFKRFLSINYIYNNDTMNPFFRKVAYHCSAIMRTSLAIV